MRKVLLLVAVVAFVAGATAALADNGGGGRSQASAQAGVCTPAAVSCSQSRTAVAGGGSRAEAVSTPLLAPGETCDVAAGPNQVRTASGATAQPFGLSSSCKAAAVGNNRAAAASKSNIIALSAEQGSLTVGQSKAQSFSSRRGSASRARFTLVSAESEQGSLTVLDCTSTSKTGASGKTTTETHGTLIEGNGEGAEDPGLCAAFVTTSSSKG